MAGERPPLDPLTPENTGADVITVIYCLATVSIVVAVIYFGHGANRRIPFRFDDATYVVANLWAIGSTILWTFAVHYGLGQRKAALSESNIDTFFKFVYAAQFVEIVAMFCAKVAFVLLSDRVRENGIGKQIKTATWSFIGAWAVFSLFTLAFQCPLPRPWVFEPAHCPTHGRILYPIIAFNAITDIGLPFLVVPTVWRLQMPLRNRILTVVLFCLRASILIPATIEMNMMHLFLDNIDQSRVTVNRAILNQITVYVSIITAAIPRANPFLLQLISGRNGFVLSDFEIFDAGQMTAPKPDPPLPLAPAHDSVLSATVSSDTSNNRNEGDVYTSEFVIVAVENPLRLSKATWKRRAEDADSL